MVLVWFGIVSKRFRATFEIVDLSIMHCRVHTSYITYVRILRKMESWSKSRGRFHRCFFFIHLLRAKDGVPSAVGRAWKITFVILLYIIYVILYELYIILFSINRNDNITIILYKINTDNNL